jgi:hypothetical protein
MFIIRQVAPGGKPTCLGMPGIFLIAFRRPGERHFHHSTLLRSLVYIVIILRPRARVGGALSSRVTWADWQHIAS